MNPTFTCTYCGEHNASAINKNRGFVVELVHECYRCGEKRKHNKEQRIQAGKDGHEFYTNYINSLKIMNEGVKK